MGFPIELNRAHGTLVLLEFAAVQISILATFFALLIAIGTAIAVRFLGKLAGLSEGTVDLLVLGVLVASAVVLLSAGALAVVGYRYVFDHTFDTLSPLPIAGLPLLGVVGPLVYGAVVLETRSLPWWLFAVVGIAANAAAFRAITVFSLPDSRRRTGVLVGALAGIPGAVALVTIVTTYHLDGVGDEVARSVFGAATEAPIPHRRWLLVVLPLLVAGAYVTQRVAVDTDGVSLPGPRRVAVPRVFSDWSRPSLDWSRHSPDWSRLEVLDRVRRSRVNESSESATDSSRPARQPRSSRPPRPPRSASAPAPSSPPPSSPKPGRIRRRSASGSDSDRPNGKSDQSNSDGGSLDSAENSSDRSTGGDSDRSPDENTNDGAVSGPSNTSSDDPASDRDDASDTRIFVDDFGTYGSDRTPVETCPDCEGDIPSDGVYKYCPFCGYEL